MSKIIKLSDRRKEKEEEFEVCVICNSRTSVKRDMPIEERDCYMEGAGQLCYECFGKIN